MKKEAGPERTKKRTSKDDAFEPASVETQSQGLKQELHPRSTSI